MLKLTPCAGPAKKYEHTGLFPSQSFSLLFRKLRVSYNDLKNLMDFLKLLGKGTEKWVPEDTHRKSDDVWSNVGEM